MRSVLGSFIQREVTNGIALPDAGAVRECDATEGIPSGTKKGEPTPKDELPTPEVWIIAA